MKPLSSKRVRRGEKLDEWISSRDQLTDQGRADFWQRQQERMRQAQESNVRALKKVGK